MSNFQQLIVVMCVAHFSSRPDLTQSIMHGNGADDGSQPSASNLSLNYALDQTA